MSVSISIHDLDEETASWIRQEAERRGISMEEMALELIHQAVDRRRLPTYDDLDALAGTWTDDQARAFLRSVADFEQVDDKLWE
jgi:plasmid stability protein